MRLVFFIYLISITSLTKAQQHDSIVSKVDSTKLHISGLGNFLSYKVDSIQTLTKVSRAMDSIKILSWADTLRQKVNVNFIADSLNLNRRFDSLRSLGFKAKKIKRHHEKYLKKIQSKRTDLLGEVNDKQRELQQKVTGSYNNWQRSVQQKFKLDSIGLKIPGADLSKVQKFNVPVQNLKLSNTSTPNLPSIHNIPRLDASGFSNMKLSKDILKIGGNTSLPSTSQLQNWDKSIQSMPQFKESTSKISGYKSMFKDPGTATEGAMKQIGDVSVISKQLDQAKSLQKANETLQIAEKIKSDEALKLEAKNMVQKEAVNHFKGQERALKSAMDQMVKYKQKYYTLKSIKDIPKNDWKPHNGLKGRPFHERFRVGLHTGIQNRKDTIILDFYPNASYKITGRLEAGIGAIYKVRTSTKTYSLDQEKPVWGMASFVIIKTFKSTYFRTEVDGTSNPRSITSENPSAREWRWNFLAGVQTNYKISKSFTGNVQMLYNFEYNLKDKFPEALTLRFGVQYKLKAKR